MARSARVVTFRFGSSQRKDAHHAPCGLDQARVVGRAGEHLGVRIERLAQRLRPERLRRLNGPQLAARNGLDHPARKGSLERVGNRRRGDQRVAFRSRPASSEITASKSPGGRKRPRGVVHHDQLRFNLR